jgi:hypothetical protein
MTTLPKELLSCFHIPNCLYEAVSTTCNTSMAFYKNRFIMHRTISEDQSSEPIKSIMLNEIMELRAWPVLKPHRSDLIASLLIMAGVLIGMKDESSYKSFFEKAEAGCIRISWKRLMDKKEGGESQLDVGGKE